MNLIKKKIDQTISLLKESDLDCWIIFVRETDMNSDPAMPLVVGHDVVWQSFFIYTKQGDAIALVGNFDQDDFVRSGCFTEVHTYKEGIGEDLRKHLSRLDPKRIAVNYSTSNVAADGLSHGMYLLLEKYLKDTPYLDRLESAGSLISRLRAIKLPVELEYLKEAACLADEAWQKALAEIQIGMSEIQVSSVLEYFMKKDGNNVSFPTIVNAGSKTNPGHAAPTDAKLTAGDLLHVDFGIIHKGFCSDIQRLLYFKRPNENEPPPELTEAFNLVRDIIVETGKLSVPGATGVEIDALARKMLKENGFDEYQHALGHQLGRSVHDGSAIIGPKWDRYGGASEIPLEKNNVFTLELEIMLPGIGCVGLEEDMYVTENGAEFISPRQLELIVK